MSLAPDAAPSLSVADPAFQLAFDHLMTHSWSHGCLLEDGQLLRDIERLHGIPAVMIHGALRRQRSTRHSRALHRPGAEASSWFSTTPVTAAEPPRHLAAFHVGRDVRRAGCTCPCGSSGWIVTITGRLPPGHRPGGL